MSEHKKTRDELLDEIQQLQQQLETIDAEGSRSKDGESSLSRRVVLGSAWVAPVIVSATLPADAQSPPSSTQQPTSRPTQSPTNVPTQSPTNVPTQSPTNVPTQSPTNVPTASPTQES